MPRPAKKKTKVAKAKPIANKQSIAKKAPPTARKAPSKPRTTYRPRAGKVATPATRRQAKTSRATRVQPALAPTLTGFITAIHAVFSDQLALAVHQADSATRETITALINLRK